MKNKKLFILLPIIVVFIFIIFSITFARSTVKINNEKINEEELTLYLKENFLKYEDELRLSNNIPENTSLEEFFGKKKFITLINNKNIDNISKIKAQQILASKYKVEDFSSFEELKDKKDKENISREKKISNGEAIYGVQNFDLFNYITYYTDQLRNKMIEILLKENKVGDKSINEYYEKMDQPLYTDTERVKYNKFYLKTNETFNAKNINQYKKEVIELSFTEIRDLIKENNIPESYLLNFSTDRVNQINSKDDQDVYIQFVEFNKDKELSDASKGIITKRLVEEIYQIKTEEIRDKFKITNERIGEKTVKKFYNK